MASISPRRSHTPRDNAIYAALERGPHTAEQLLKVSQTWTEPFTSDRCVRLRMQKLTAAGRVRQSWYAIAGPGGSPAYYQLTLEGYRILLQDQAAEPPTKRYFAEVSVSMHRHMRRLMDAVVHTLVAAHRLDLRLVNFARESTSVLWVDDQPLSPDCGFDLVTPKGKSFTFYYEIDNSTETIRSASVEKTIERKLLLYDRHRDGFPRGQGYRVVFFTKSQDRRDHILQAAAALVSNPDRSLFYAAVLDDYLSHNDALITPCLLDHHRDPVSLIPQTYAVPHHSLTSVPQSLVPLAAAC